jgi:signal transduction histidine kinase
MPRRPEDTIPLVVERVETRDRATLLAVAFTLLALAALGVGAFLLARAQERQREDARERFGQRAEIASSLIDSLFRVAFVGASAEASDHHGGARVDEARLERELGANRYAIVIDTTGRVLGATSNVPEGTAERMARRPRHVRQALTERGYGLSDVQDGVRPVIETAIGFGTPSGPRVLVNGQLVSVFREFLDGTLAPLPEVSRSEAFVLDGNGRLLGAAAREGRPRLPQADLVSQSGRGDSGTYEGRDGPAFYQDSALAGSRWHVAVSADEDELYQALSGTGRWIPWAILGVGALALLAVGLLLSRLSRQSGALRASNVELARSNADLEQFAYAASHDLSAPLRTVAGFSQLLRQRYAGRLDDEADAYIEHMASGVDRMQQLIDDLLLYSRVGRAPVGQDAVDLEGVLAEVLESLAEPMAERGAVVTSDDLPVVRGERGQLAQVLTNLVSNAVKFTAPDVRPEVHVGAEREGAAWRLSVRDNGIGIDADSDVIFKMFGRLHPADAYPGTGIGLALVKRIVERHGGRIWVEPCPGGGSVFSFTLPDRAPVSSQEPVGVGA